MDCVVTPLKTLMGFSVHLNVQLKFYNLPELKRAGGFPQPFYFTLYNYLLNLFSRQFTKSACNLC